MTSQERTRSLGVLGTAIAHELTNIQNPLASAWRYVVPAEDTWQTYLVNGEGARIYIQYTDERIDGQVSRLSISGWLHIGKNQQYVQVYDEHNNRLSSGSITVALARGIENIAKDILRRFLPHYLEVFALAQRKVAADARYEHSLTENLRVLCDKAGLKPPYHDERRTEIPRQQTGSVNGYYITINASANADDQEITLDHLSIEQAAYLLKWIKTQPRRN
jgi:hypothetical protein